MTRRIPYPENAYLAELGRSIYALAYLEWGLLGDLPHLQGLPPAISVQALAGKTTAVIAQTIRSNLASVSDPKVSEWLQAHAEALDALAPRRNGVVHARPATIGGKQRLNRWARVRG